MAAKPTYHQKATRNDLMTDLETYGTSDDSVIISIGGLRFDPFGDRDSIINEEGELIAPSFYCALHVETQKGRLINHDTLKWWDSPNRVEAHRQILDDPNKLHLPQALDAFWDFIKDNCRGGKAWACAPSFDIDMLSNAFRTSGVCKMKGSRTDFPIPFWDNMDVRTIENFVFGGKYRGQVEGRTGTYHNALDDCVTQALMIQEAGKKLRESGAIELADNLLGETSE